MSGISGYDSWKLRHPAEYDEAGDADELKREEVAFEASIFGELATQEDLDEMAQDELDANREGYSVISSELVIVDEPVIIDFGSLRGKHAEFLVANLTRLAATEKSQAAIYANALLGKLVGTYPETAKADSADPFDDIQPAGKDYHQ